MKDDIQINEIKLIRSINNINNIIQHPFLLEKKLNILSRDLVTVSSRIKLLLEILNEIKMKNEKVCSFLI